MTYRLAGAAILPGFDKVILGRLETAFHAALPDAGFIGVLGLGPGFEAAAGSRPAGVAVQALLADCGLAAILFPPLPSPAFLDAAMRPAGDAAPGAAGPGCASFASLDPDGSIAYRVAGRPDDPEDLARALAKAARRWPVLPGPSPASSASDPSLPVVLVGPMASGKTTLASLLARRAGAAFIDLDSLVEARAGLPVSRIFGTEGEEGFRLRESEALEEALDKASPKAGSAGAVIATGGGAVLPERNRALLAARARVVWLHADPAVLAARAAVDEAAPAPRRPLLSGVDPLARLSALQRERLPFYASVASFLLPVEGRKADILAEVLHDALF